MFKTTALLLKETVQEWQHDHASNVAAALAYYTVFSLSPLLILLALFIGIVLDRSTLSDDLFNDVEATIGEDAADTLRQLMLNNDQQAQQQETSFWGKMVWFSVVIWGASGVFAQLQSALNRIWEVRAIPGRSPLVFFKNRILSLAVVIVAGFLLLVSMAINTGLSVLIHNFEEIRRFSFLIRPIQLITTMMLLTILFAMIYKILPDALISWKVVWVGSLFTAFLFFIGQFAVGLYLANSNVGTVFGAAGSLTVILVWIYYSSQILLFGAEFTEVWARHIGIAIRPDDDAVWVNEAQARREAEAAGLVFNEQDTVQYKVSEREQRRRLRQTLREKEKTTTQEHVVVQDVIPEE